MGGTVDTSGLELTEFGIRILARDDRINLQLYSEKDLAVLREIASRNPKRIFRTNKETIKRFIDSEVLGRTVVLTDVFNYIDLNYWVSKDELYKSLPQYSREEHERALKILEKENKIEITSDNVIRAISWT